MERAIPLQPSLTCLTQQGPLSARAHKTVGHEVLLPIAAQRWQDNRGVLANVDLQDVNGAYLCVAHPDHAMGATLCAQERLDELLYCVKVKFFQGP